MARRSSREFMVGTFVAMGLIILSVGVMSVGGESGLFTATTTYRVLFDDTDGLRVGSPVKMAGVRIGAISGIRLSTDPLAQGIEVRVQIRKEYAGRVRADSRAGLRYLQWLSGEKYVEITPGNPDLEVLADGAHLSVTDSFELFEQGEDIAQNLTEVTISLSEILEPLRNGEGLLGALIHDPDFGKEGIAHLNVALDNLQALTGQIRKGRGFIGRAVFDPTLENRVDDLSRAIESLASFLEALGRREGAVGALVNEDGAGLEAIVAMRDAATSLKDVTGRLEAREGLIGRLLNDPEYSDGVADDLRAILHNTAEITRKINDGDGTLGALVNDRSLHDGMEDVVSGVNDSGFARWLVKKYRKKGIDTRLDEQEAGSLPEE